MQVFFEGQGSRLKVKLALLLVAVFVPLVFGDAVSQTKLSWPPNATGSHIQYLKSLPGDLKDPAESKVGNIASSIFSFITGNPNRAKANKLQMTRPNGLCVYKDKLFVADPGVGRILQIDLVTGQRAWIPRESEPALPSPVGVAADSQGRIFVTDSVMKKVIVYLVQDGKVFNRLKDPPRPWVRPTGIVVHEASDRIWVADTGENCIHAFDLKYNYLFSVGKRGSKKGEFNYPTYLWADTHTGQLWVCDSANFRLQWFDTAGKFLGALGEMGNRPGYLARPRGIALDSESHIYCTDGAMETVQVFDPKGQLLLFFGESGAQPGTFSLPAGIFIDEKDQLYVADSYNARVQVFKYENLKEAKP